MNKGRISIKDLAKKLGVAPSTVSRALNDRGRVSPETKASVLKLAESWGYQPNPFAANLAKKRTGLIGLILPEFTHHYFAKVLSGVNEIVNQSGYHLIINIHEGSVEREKEIIQMLSSMHVEGVIASYAKETSGFEHYLDLMENNIPLVFVDRMSEDLDVSYVISDDFNGTLKAVDHLVSMGRKRIAYVSGPENLSTSFARRVGYEEGVKKNALVSREEWVLSQDLEDWKERLIDLIHRDHIDAVITYTDYLSFEVIERLKEAQINVPDDISVVGFADEPVASYMTPRLTTVRQPARQMGVRAAEILVGVLEGTIDHLIQEKISTHIVTRESTKIV